MPATFFSPTFGTTQSFISGKRGSLKYHLRRMMAHFGTVEFGQEAKQLTGAAVGANTVTVTGKRVDAPSTGLVGGVRAIENQGYVRSSVTATADETEVDAMAVVPSSLTFVANGDGNPRVTAGG